MSEKPRPTPPGKNASAAEWEAYLDASGLGVDAGAYQGGQKYEGFGLGVKSERWEEREDAGEHSRMCPLNLKGALTGHIDQVNERPVEDEVLGNYDED